MKKYLLNTEKNNINNLINILNTSLYRPISPKTQETFISLIRNNKDSNIEDTLNNFLNLLIDEMYPILTSNTTKGIQFGIKNKIFQIEAFGGTYNKETPIKKDTLFSLDSISKIITSIIVIKNITKGNFKLNTKINELNNDYNLDATIESILKFTACIRTEKRIDNLSKEETIKILKNCREILTIKNNYKNFFEYNDIGYMILRNIIPNFLNDANNILKNTNITYNPNKYNTTGGKINEEYITQDPKGRNIIFPGHTGLYSNITNLLNFFYKLINKEEILTKKELNALLDQPYSYPYCLNNQTQEEKCITKTSGMYIAPKNLKDNYNKLRISDMPDTSTKLSIASAGTGGSWIMFDNLKTNNKFDTYTTGILTNPYSYVENKTYPFDINDLENTNLKVSYKGKIIHYSRQLNPYKIIMTNYAIILELLTEYLKINESGKKILTKKII